VPRTKTTLVKAKMQSETTSRYEYPAKMTSRPRLIVPCDNIRTADIPLLADTTTSLSYIKPDVIKRVHSYKPIMQYSR